MASYKSKFKEKKFELYYKKFLFSTIGAGIGWGSAGILLFPIDNIYHQFFTCLALVGVGATGVVTLSVRKSTIFGFLIAILVPLALRFIIIESSDTIMIGIFVILFLLALIFSAVQVHKNTMQLILLHLKNKNKEKELENSERKYFSLLENLPIGVFQISTESADKFQYINNYFIGFAHKLMRHI